MQNTDTINVYANSGRNYPIYSFRPVDGCKIACAITTRPALWSRLYWETQRQDFSGNMVDMLCSKDGHSYDAPSLIRLAHAHRRKSKRNQKSAYLIHSVVYLIDSES